MRLRPLVLVALVAAALVPLQGAASEEAAPCPGYQYVESQGWSCPVPGGWEVLLADGTRLLTHGPDAAPEAAATSGATALAPAYPPSCVPNGTTQWQNLLIYAVPADRADRYDTLKDTLRNLAASANGHLRGEAGEFGESATYKFACDTDGAVTVVRARLPTTTATDSFSTIVSDLVAQGYGKSHVKHWVWYDGSFAGIGGQGHVNNDDTNRLENANNRGGHFALTYGYLDWGIMMHESGHNMGAVQLSAPNTSGGWHCNDGIDIMCYSDGGSNASYSGSVCSTEHFDCGHNDYFNPLPAPGSYLDTHWNIASPFNRFLDLSDRPPTAPAITCPSPVGVGKEVVCNLVAYDEGPVSFEVEWGDGATDRVPATGAVASGAIARATHAYETLGVKPMRARATDTASPAQTSGWTEFPIRVTCGFQRSAHVPLGLNGIEVQNVSMRFERGVHPACWERPYTVDHPAFTTFRVCWNDAADADLGCGPDAGVVPPGAASARMVLMQGVDGAYLLKVD